MCLAVNISIVIFSFSFLAFMPYHSKKHWDRERMDFSLLLTNLRTCHYCRHFMNLHITNLPKFPKITGKYAFFLILFIYGRQQLSKYHKLRSYSYIYMMC